MMTRTGESAGNGQNEPLTDLGRAERLVELVLSDMPRSTTYLTARAAGAAAAAERNEAQLNRLDELLRMMVELTLMVNQDVEDLARGRLPDEVVEHLSMAYLNVAEDPPGAE